MKIIVQQTELLETLEVVGKAIANSPPLPILSSILLTAQTDKLVLSATDLYLGIKSAISASVQEPGTIALPGKEFKQIINGLNQSKISIEKKNENTVEIISNKNVFTLQTHQVKEFPEFPARPKENAFISTEVLESINNLIVPSASSDQTRPVLTSVLINQTSNYCEVVATDGFRLSKMTMGQVLNNSGQLLLPAKTISEIYRVILKEKIKNLALSSSQELKQAVVSVGKFDFYIRLIEGEYPPYQKIIPQNPKTSIVLDSDELMENLKRTLVFSDKNQAICRFFINEKNLEIKAASSNLGSYNSVIDNVKTTGEKTQIAFNTQYVLDFLKAVEAAGHNNTEIRLEMLDAMKPAIFSCPLLKDFIYVVMPFRVSG